MENEISITNIDIENKKKLTKIKNNRIILANLYIYAII